MSGMPNEPPEKPNFEKIFGDALAKGGFPDLPEAGSYNETAIAQHEIYSSLRVAGFTTAQALYMTAVAVSGLPGPPPSDEPEQSE